MLFIQTLCQSLNGSEIEYALAGAYAVAFHGAPRGTVDIDLVVRWEAKNITALQASLNQNGLVSRQPLEAEDIYQFRDEYITKRGLISWNFFNPNDRTEIVDIILTYDLDPEDAISLDIGEVTVPVLSLEKLIEMKQASAREQDIFDLEALLAIQNRRQ